jgi:hypothetical protein
MGYDKAWSYSALNNFEQCASKYYHLSVAKDVKEPPSEHLSHGHHVHQAFERRVRDGDKLPIGMRQYEPMMAAFAAQPGDVRVEQKLAITNDFGPCEWFAKHAWVRGMIDYLCVQDTKALVIDYKTGKRKDNDEQLSLMAGLIFVHAEEVQEVQASFFWMQEPEGQQFDTIVLTRADLPKIFSAFMPRVQRYQLAHRTTTFPATPSGLCRRFCPVRMCPHHGQ